MFILNSITAIVKTNRPGQWHDKASIDLVKIGNKTELFEEKWFIGTSYHRAPFLDDQTMVIHSGSSSADDVAPMIVASDIKNKLPLAELKFNLTEAPGLEVWSIAAVELLYIDLRTKEFELVRIDDEVLKEFCKNNGYNFDPNYEFGEQEPPEEMMDSSDEDWETDEFDEE